MRIRLRCALEELLGRTLKAQPLIAFQQHIHIVRDDNEQRVGGRFP